VTQAAAKYITRRCTNQPDLARSPEHRTVRIRRRDDIIAALAGDRIPEDRWVFTLRDEVEASRNKLLRAVGCADDITFIRGYGNIGDHLIYAGCRRLLADFSYKEVSILALDGVRGHTALISGGGAWCRPYHDMPRYLSIIENSFERVVVLPSSFDLSEESVRQALSATRALVFAREPASYQQIRSVCQAEIAHDCAFFFDYSPFSRPGQGTLTAYRSDKESAAGAAPEGNNDISVSCESLDQWLWTIARYQTVKTDRAHVMIAAALLGKQVHYKASSYHKVPSIAGYSLKDYPVFPETGQPDLTAVGKRPESLFSTAIDLESGPGVEASEGFVTPELRAALMGKAQENLKAIPAGFLKGRTEPEITVVILSHGRLDCTTRAVRSLIENTRAPIKVLVIDNGSADDVRSELRALDARYDCMQLILLNENLGCAGGRMYALEFVQTPYVAFIDNDVEVLPSAIEHLLYRLETNPQAVAVAGMIVRPDGTVQLCGGDYRIDNGVFWHIFLGVDRLFDDPLIGASGPCLWVNGTMILIRKDFLDRNHFDPLMRHYYEDVEWCFRLNQSSEGLFCRSVEAMAIHYHEPKAPSTFLGKNERHNLAIRYIESIARFYQAHGKVIEAIFMFMPELGSPINVSSARKVLELVNAYGSQWVLDEWNQGELAPLFAPALFQAAATRKYSELPDDSIVLRLREAIASLSGRVARDIEFIAEQEDKIGAQEEKLGAQQDKIGAQEEQLCSKDAELARMRGSLGWRLLSRYGRIKYRFLLPIYRRMTAQPK
jgi:GT2 family glycosyltransferase/exopolysaccharide biosynthesis predicted pyruvyltransferase EpsI